MKKLITPPPLFFFQIIFICFLLSFKINAQLPVIVKDWASFSGIQDSTFKTPVINDSDFTYVATFTINTGSGADILIVKYDKEGDTLWTQTWTGPGNGRDQASDLAHNDTMLFVSGITFTSAANNFDYVTLSVSKETGDFYWTNTFNGTGSNYDAATAITLNNEDVFVTGLANNTSTSLDYTTIAYAISNGTEHWR